MFNHRLLTFLVIFFAAIANADNSLVLSPAGPHLNVGEQQVLTVAPTTDPATLTFTFDASIVSFNTANLTITAVKPGETEFSAKALDGTTSNSIKIKVDPINVTAAAFNQPMVEGETRPLQVIVTSSSGAPLTYNMVVTSANPGIAEVTNNAVKATSTSRATTATTLVVKSNDVVLGSIPVQVREAIEKITAPATIELEEGKTRDLGIKLTGKHGSEFSPSDRPITVTADSNLVNTTSNLGVIQAAELPDGTVSTTVHISISSKEGLGNNNPVTAQTTVILRVRPGRISFSPSPVSLPRAGTARVTARLLDRTGGDSLTIKGLTWALKNPANDQYVKLSPVVEDNSLLIFWNDVDAVREESRPRLIEITATAVSTLGTTINDSVIVQLTGQVTEFAPLQVKLNFMDDLTAADLYGQRTAEEYFVTRIRLNNNLNTKKDGNLGAASILAFSDSIEVAVVYEKRKLREGGRPDRHAQWEPVSAKDLDDFYFAPTQNPPDPRSSEPTCRGFLTYRPYMFEMMVNTVDRREDRGPRGRVLKALGGIGTLGSFVTSVAVPGAQSDWPLGLDKFSNLFIPGIEKLWPSLKETNRQNLVSQTMKTIEEIPFGSDLSRVLFFPKHPFTGLVRNYETRIIQICPYHFKIEVAVITKEDRQAVQAVP